MMTWRILTDPLLWCLLLLLALLFGMPHMTRLFAALFPALDRSVYLQDGFAALAFAYLWLVLVSSIIAVVIGAGIWVTQPAGRAFHPLLETRGGGGANVLAGDGAGGACHRLPAPNRQLSRWSSMGCCRSSRRRLPVSKRCLRPYMTSRPERA